jgi:hypothetical protein
MREEWHGGCTTLLLNKKGGIHMKSKTLRNFFAAAVITVAASSIAGCYYDDHDHWPWHDGYYGYYGGRYGYDRDDYYRYRRGYDRDDYWWHR